MHQMEDPPPAPERSRRRPPRSRTTEPVPLPIPPAASRRGKTVKLQDVMEAYQRALIDAVEARLAAASEAAAEATRQAVADDLGARLRDIGDAVAGLAGRHHALADEVTRRTGKGVVGVARVIRQDLESLRRDVADLGRRVEALETSVRSLHRTLAWEGMRMPRAGGPATSSNG